ncbi:MAG: arylsulfatase [Planctomycetes bacterium]|nr:arylsulfatase [Planctomycetota bacterium]
MLTGAAAVAAPGALLAASGALGAPRGGPAAGPGAASAQAAPGSAPAAPASAQPPAPRPNIVLIMSDDMGFSDLGCYGGEIRTPNLDALAARGIRFTQFYNTARCCPTRASLLTGLYPHQAGVGHMMDDRGLPGYTGNLNKNCRTIAEVLRPAGYANYMAGKWHVAKDIKPEGPKFNWPLQRGFDRFYGTIHGAGSFYDPCSLTRDNTQIPPGSPDYYYTDAISDNAARFIADHRREKPGRPFFLYVAYTAAHWPMHARQADVARCRGRYDNGWQALRAERCERMLAMGLIDKRWGISPPDSRPWDEVPHDEKDWHLRRMEVYAAMVEVMDRGIGRIVDELRRTGCLDDTLIFFLEDNGGCAEEYGSQGPVKPDPAQPVVLRPMAADELQPAMQPPLTRDGRPVRTGRGVVPGPADTYVAYGKEWANVSNTPFRWYKHWVHEGGIATPLIVHWPAALRRQGELEHTPGHLIDIMATCVEAAGAAYPAQHEGTPITPLEGRSLLPLFEGRPVQREAIYWEHEGNRAVREGRWKLVARGPAGPWELYDMQADRCELTDLAAREPERVNRMAAMWQAWAERASVLPWPWKPLKPGCT